MKQKLYKTSSGRRFAISDLPKPEESDEKGVYIFFTSSEFEWIKQKNIRGAELDCLWELKKADYNYDPIPEADNQNAKLLAHRYAPLIMSEIRKRRA